MDAIPQNAKPTSAQIFVNENLERLENRINVTIFGAQAIPEFWKPFCELMDIPRDAWLNRIIVQGTSLRPDFLVMVKEEAIAWIEVELGERVGDQNRSYKESLSPSRVLALVGKTENKHNDPSLERVAEIAKTAADEIGDRNPQAKAILAALVELINEAALGGPSSPAIADIPSGMLEKFDLLLQPLLELRESGLLVNRPTNEASLSLQLRKGPSVKSPFAVLTMRDGIHFLLPSPDEMDRIFKEPLKEVVVLWRKALDVSYPAWSSHVDGNNRIKMKAEAVQKHAAVFTDAYNCLRTRLIGPPSG